MTFRIGLAALLAAVFVVPVYVSSPAPACCPAPPSGKPVVNADQTVIIIWDAAKKRQHFIRKASFKSEADNFGFLIPSPNKPKLDESGNDAFPSLADITKPEIVEKKRPSGGGGCGCIGAGSKSSFPAAKENSVQVELQKEVAGFHAAVLKATDAKSLVDWLKENGYASSPEIEAWAEPYIKQKWRITALKVAKNKDAKKSKKVSADALRMSFKTDKPLFPYREPDYSRSAKELIKDSRLLRIFFIAEARYEGKLPGANLWTGKVVWSNKLKDEAKEQLLKQLKLPKDTGPKEWWLTEFEDNWPYKVAPGDVYFSKSRDQSTVKRKPIIRYVASTWPNDPMAYALVAVVVVPPLLRRVRWKKLG